MALPEAPGDPRSRARGRALPHGDRPSQSLQVEQLYTALTQHGPAALHRALALAHERELYDAPHVLRLLAQEVA